jgi:hypothetical protein
MAAFLRCRTGTLRNSMASLIPAWSNCDFGLEFNIRPTYPDKPLCGLLQQATMWLAMTAIAHMQLIEGTEHVLLPNTDRIRNKYIQLFGAG